MEFDFEKMAKLLERVGIPVGFAVVLLWIVIVKLGSIELELKEISNHLSNIHATILKTSK
jgi:hypothetical protein